MIIAAGPPAASVPPPGVTLSQAGILVTIQLSGAVPVLVRDQICAAGLNGPPNGPSNVKSVPGAIRSAAAGASRAASKLLPVGVPQPVQRS